MRIIYIIFSLFVLLGCKERFRFDVAEGESKYFIDGFITNVEKSHEFRIFRTIPLEKEQYEPETAAQVSLIINDTEEVGLEGGTDGVYCTPVMSAKDGDSYKLRIVVEWGTIESKNQELPDSDPGPELGLEVRTDSKEFILSSGTVRFENGVSFSTTIQKQPEATFYQWVVREHFILDAELNSSQPATKFCYITNYPIRTTLIHEDNPIDGVEEYSQDLLYLGFSRKFDVDFSLEVQRLVLNAEAFQFQELVKSQATNTGGLFDVSVFSIPGNYTYLDADRDVLGFFGVYRESSDRIFISQNELPYSLKIDQSCFGPFGRMEGPREYCYNCLDAPDGYYSITNTKPDWWR